MPNFKAIVAGHSNVPSSFPEIPFVQLEVIRIPGAKLSDFWMRPEFAKIRDQTYDLAILYLGGNDINNDSQPRIIINEIKDILRHLLTIHRRVTFVSLEPRRYRPNNRFGINPEGYSYVAKYVNKHLSPFLRKNSIRTINVTLDLLREGHTRDGVHFLAPSQAYIRRKIVRCVQHFEMENEN